MEAAGLGLGLWLGSARSSVHKLRLHLIASLGSTEAGAAKAKAGNDVELGAGLEAEHEAELGG